MGVSIAAARQGPSLRLSAVTVRKLRLASGLVLFTYVTLHLLNHALGNVSVAAMEGGLAAQEWLWQGVLGTLVLYAALGTHFTLGLWALYERRHFGWTGAEIAQLLLGLTIPLLLMNHIWVTRMALTLYGVRKGYAQELYSFWVASPAFGLQQLAVLIVAWIHGCIGLRQWLRLKPFYPRQAPLLLTAATALPMLAMLGFYQGGRAVAAVAADPAWRAANLALSRVGTAAEGAQLADYRNLSLVAFVALVALIMLARGVRALAERHGRSIRIVYPNGRTARVPRGFSVLEASRAARIAHASVCGGRARCSTCRVRVLTESRCVPPPSAGEQAVLDRVNAGPGVRLACQLRPTGDIAVAPLLSPHAASAALPHPDMQHHGEERFVVALVADMRNSTRLAEARLPFDAMFTIDRFVAALGEAVVGAGGRVTSFTGDGMIATFGIEGRPELACRQAIGAAARIGNNIAALNRALEHEGAEPVAFGIGIHGSTAVVGEIGYASTRIFTTLGDAANVATRLEAMCKEFACEAVISETVCAQSGLALDALARQEVPIRGRSAPVAVRIAGHTAELRSEGNDDAYPAFAASRWRDTTKPS